MKIIDKNNNVVTNPDLKKGHLEPDRLLIAHHEATPAIEEQWHYEVTAVYPNGGKDVIKVIDVSGQAAKEAYDEYEEVLRYIEYTPEQLAKLEEERKKVEAEAQRLPNLEKENKLLQQQVQALSNQNDFQEELIVELANIVYA